MTFWASLIDEVFLDGTLYLIGGLLLTSVIVRALCMEERPRMVLTLYMVGLHVLLIPVLAYLRMEDAPFFSEVRLVSLILAAMAGVAMFISVVFAVIMPRLHLKTPRILHDVLFVVVSLIVVFAVASQLGFNLSGLIATSAVLTGVIGFALQGTLGNIIGGLALQLDSSIAVGDWVEYEGIIGQVTEMRWRHTALETRAWETVLIPNEQLVSGRVTVLGKRLGKPRQWRRKIEFHVDYFHAPTKVIEIVNHALHESPVDGAAMDPEPHALLIELDESYGQYALRYWLMDIEDEEIIASTMRSRLYFALKRHRIRLALPSEQIFLTQSSQRQAESKKRHESYKLGLLRSLDLFSSLSEEECQMLVGDLSYSPFACGEHMVTQGEETTELYILTVGKAQMLVDVGGSERELGTLDSPAFFGEMALMTGEPRSASVIATTDTESYRLEQHVFERIIQNRPDVADHVAMVLAERQVELDMLREEFDAKDMDERLEARQWEMLGKIRSFFGLSKLTKVNKG